MPHMGCECSFFGQQLVEIGDGLLQALLQLHLGLPVVQVFAGATDVGLALQGVVGRQGPEHQPGRGAGECDHFFGQLPNGEFVGVAQVDGAGEAGATVGCAGGVHEAHEAFNEVVHITKAAGLLAVAIQGDVFAFEGLHDEVADHPPVVGVHARAVGVENAGHANVQPVLAVVVKKQGFGAALAFVVAAAWANGVHVAPVSFGLRVHGRVAIHLAGAGLKNARFHPFGQAQHVDGAVHAGFGGLHRVVLVVHRAGRAGQVVDLVNFEVQRKRHVVANELEARVVVQVLKVALAAGEQVVSANHVVAALKQAVNEVAAQKTGAAGDENALGGVVVAHGVVWIGVPSGLSRCQTGRG